MPRFMVNGQMVPKTKWKQTDGQTDGQIEAIELLPLLMQSAISSYDDWTIDAVANLLQDAVYDGQGLTSY